MQVNCNKSATNHKFVIELVSEQWIRQFAEVEFQQRTDTMNVAYVNIVIQRRRLIIIELISTSTASAYTTKLFLI